MPINFGNYGSPLLPIDYEDLERCYITREIADSAGLRRLTSEEGKQIVGRADHEDYSAILYPFVWPGELAVSNHRIRRFNPPFEFSKGRRKERQKYLSPPGYGNSIYFHPRTDPEILHDPRVAMAFTEGQKKVLALVRLSYETQVESGSGPLFVPAGFNGVWGFRGRTSIVTNETGRRVPEHGAIPDLDRITWQGRKVYVIYDTNVHSDSQVAAARNQLAAELTSRGAEVYLVDIPCQFGVNGIDDFLARNGPSAALELLATARSFSPKEKIATLPFTDHGNELAFELLFGDEFRYNITTKQWLHWNGVIWQPDSVGFTDRAILTVAKERLQATEKIIEDPAEHDRTGDARTNRRKAIGAALKLQNVSIRQAALESAKSNPKFVRSANEFDRNDLLLACGNGVLNLETQDLRPGNRDDLLTQWTKTYWEPEATCPRWQKFLEDVFPNSPGMRAFIQRAVGYSLTGLTREEVFFILYGTGRNGKGTLLRTLLHAFGDYGYNAEFSTLITDRNRGRAPRNDIAALAGKRFVTAQESAEDARLDESLIKSLTGGDLITARFLHKEFFTFSPTWKIWLATNHRPQVNGGDVGIWSRPKLIPFNVSFDGHEDRGLKDALLQPGEASGILRWAVDGCRAYLRDGLGYPEEVVEATASYRIESDTVGRFIDDACEIGENFQVRARVLYNGFQRWAGESNFAPLTETAFGLRMKNRPFEKKSDGRGVAYVGLRLIEPQESPT